MLILLTVNVKTLDTWLFKSIFLGYVWKSDSYSYLSPYPDWKQWLQCAMTPISLY